jgi:putative Holliday junction resolvase
VPVKILAVDPGSARVGLALSDETETLATPLDTMRAGADLAHQVARVAVERGAGLVLVGLPRQLDGSEGSGAKDARRLAAALRAAGLRVELWDERFTSRMAERAIAGTRTRRTTREQQRARVDRAAAAILLQSYLDRPRA